MRDQYEQSPEYIEEQIEQTRHHLSDTLEELQRRLSPGDIFEETLNYLKANKSFGRNVTITVRENPIPVCLMGIGLTWLITSGASGPRHRHHLDRQHHAGAEDDFDAAPLAGDPRFSDHPEGPTPQPYPSGAESSSGKGQAKQKAADARSKASHVAESAKGKLQDAKSKLSHKTESAKDRMSGAADRAHHRGNHMNQHSQNTRHKGAGMARNMREGYHQRTHELRHRANYLIEERPLAIVAIGFGIGAALGLMLPSTAREDRMLGSTRDRLRDRAVAEGQDQFEHARESVESAAEATRERSQDARKQTQEQGKRQEQPRSGAGATSSAPTAGSSPLDTRNGQEGVTASQVGGTGSTDGATARSDGKSSTSPTPTR